MAQFRAFAQGVEVNGETVYSIVDGMGSFKHTALSVLSENGIKDPKPGQWYSQQKWLDAFRNIAETIGPSTLFSIGLKIPENAQFPPEIDSIEKALSAIDVAYHMNHQGGEIGHYKFISIGIRSGKMVCENPYPCDFDRGLIEAMARRFKQKDAVRVKVEHDDKAPCRKRGANSCTYKISW
jgi:hypothetical protein